MQNISLKAPLKTRIYIGLWLFVCFVIGIAIVVAAPWPDPVANVTTVADKPVAQTGPLLLFAHGTKTATSADEQIKMAFSSDYHRDDDINVEDAFEYAMKSSAFHSVNPVNPETGEPQHGYFARSIYDAFAFISQPLSDPSQTWKHATELHMYWQDGALHGNFGAQFHTYRFLEGDAQNSVMMHIVFDLPSGGHKYMQAVGYEATDEGIVIDDNVMPLMLANIMTSQYMHIFIPSYDQPSEKTELVFWTDSFKDLLSAQDRARVEAAQSEADRKISATYDNEEEKPTSSEAPSSSAP
jgi:hypothetical protein